MTGQEGRVGGRSNMEAKNIVNVPDNRDANDNANYDHDDKTVEMSL